MTKLIKIELPFTGFYESIHSSQIEGAIEQLFADDHGELTTELSDAVDSAAIDYKAIHNEYAKEYIAAFASELDLTLEFDELTSPREYNFETDRIFAAIPAGQINKIRREVEKHADWPQCLRDNFTSYDGFWSHYSTDPGDEVWTRAELDECQYEVIINFWLEKIKGYEPNQIDYDLLDAINCYELETIGGDAYEAIKAEINERLERLRVELRAERISTGELIELQGLASAIDDGDVELLEAAGVPERVSEDQLKLI